MSEIIIYKTKDRKTQIDVKFENETVWLTQQQMANLFGQTKQNISLHINNCFKEKELSKKVTVKESLIVQKEGNRSVKRKLELYNLDVIISVGYRVKSIRGTEFRQWATKRLKDYLVDGIVINEKRLEQKNKEIKILHDGIKILSRAIEEKVANSNEFSWLYQFRMGLKLLDDYDNESLDHSGKHDKVALYPSTAEYMELVNTMRSEFSSAIFGRQRIKVLKVQ